MHRQACESRRDIELEQPAADTARSTERNSCAGSRASSAGAALGGLHVRLGQIMPGGATPAQCQAPRPERKRRSAALGGIGWRCDQLAKLSTRLPTTRYQPSTRTKKISLKGSEIRTGAAS